MEVGRGKMTNYSGVGIREKGERGEINERN